MGFQANGEMITVTLECFKLPEPVDNPGSHRHPIVIVVAAFFHCVFAMAVADPFLRQKIVAIRKRLFAAGGGVSRIPVQHEIGRLDRVQNLCRLSSRGCIEAGVVFQQQRDSFLARFVGRLQEFLGLAGVVLIRAHFGDQCTINHEPPQLLFRELADLRVGEEVVALPSGLRTRIAARYGF